MVYGMQKGPVKCADRAYVANVVAGFFDHIRSLCEDGRQPIYQSQWTRYGDGLGRDMQWQILSAASYWGQPICRRCFVNSLNRYRCTATRLGEPHRIPIGEHVVGR